MKFEIKLHDGKTVALPEGKKQASKYVADLIRNRGVNEDDGVEMSWQDMYNYLSPNKSMRDAIGASNLTPLLSSSMEVILREPLEPMRVVSGLFTEIRAKGLETKVLAGALGAVYADDVAENSPYPEVMFDIGGGMQTAFIGKSGLAASFTDEALRYSTWDVWSMNLRLMRAAMDRHKEQKAVRFLRNLGTELFNNLSPTTSMFGVCTGRDLSMTSNGTLTMDDLFKAMAHMTEEGFPPTALLMSPLFFYQFLQDPVMRNMMMAHGGGSYFERWQGNPGPTDPWSNGSMGSMGPSLGNRINATGNAAGAAATGIAGREHGMTSYSNLPGYFPWNFQIIVSPFIPFDHESGLGDIYLISGGSVGYHLVDEDLTEVTWRDEALDTAKVKLRERYGYAVAHEGQAIGILKNVKLGRNYWDGTVTAQTTAVTAEIDPTTIPASL